MIVQLKPIRTAVYPRLVGLWGAATFASISSPLSRYARADVLPRTRIDVRIPIKSLSSTQVVLTNGWRDQLAVGMLLDLVTAQNATVGQIRLTKVDASNAIGVLTGSATAASKLALEDDKATLQGLYAVAPFSLGITAIEGNSLSLLIPRGNRVLKPGDSLTIVRGMEPIGTATFAGYRPVSAVVTTLKPGMVIQTGDVCWAYEAAQVWPTAAASGSPSQPLVSGASSATSATKLVESVGSSSARTSATIPTVGGQRASTNSAESASASGSNPGLQVQSTPQNGNGSGTEGTPSTPLASVATQLETSSPLPANDVFAISSGANPSIQESANSFLTSGRVATSGASLSRSGATGLIRVPTAGVTPDGEVQGATFGVPGNLDLRRLGNTARYAFNAGVLPGLEVGVTIGNDEQLRDLTANAKLQVVRETRGRPALSIGIAEILKLERSYGVRSPTYYGVLSKQLLKGSTNVSVGLLRDGSTLKIRPFGGLEVGVTRQVSALVEYDSRQVNYGVRASMLRNRLQISAQHLDGGWTYQAGFRFPLSSKGKTTPTQSSNVVLPHVGSGASDAAAANTIQKRLIGLGLENVAVRIRRASAESATTLTTPSTTDALGASASTRIGTVLELSYENRTFAHNEVDALANVLATAAVLTPDQIDSVSVEIKRSDIGVLYVACALPEYRRFMNGEIDESTFASSVSVTNTRSYTGSTGEGAVESRVTAATVTADTGRDNSSFGHADVYLRPGLQTQIATETFQLGVGLDLEPELDLPLARGLNLTGRANIPLVGPLRGEETGYDRLALNYSFKPTKSLLTRAHLGRFPQRRDGLLIETLWRPENGRFLARTALGLLDRRSGGPRTTGDQKPTFVAEARYYFPQLDLSARVSGGRFLEGDKGLAFGVVRRFGDTEIGFEIRDTDIGRAALVTLGIPLGPNRVSRPGTFRLRSPDFLDYRLRTLLQRPNLVSVANATGNELSTGADLTRSLLDRDRLNRAYLLRSLPRLRRILPVQVSPSETDKPE
jgi:hypothetical protein